MKRPAIIFSKIWTIALGFACGICVSYGLSIWRHEDYAERSAALETELKAVKQRAEEAVVIRSVSKQMEEIAYQQKELSDRQRKKAELQADENFRMKLRVEEEWKRAVAAQEETEKAYQLADGQKALAEQRQRQAEHAKQVADTLAYLTLGRSLGETALAQFQTGNRRIASWLAYISWLFVKRYGGDCFMPSVYHALTLISGQPGIWQQHKGGISDIVWKNDTVFYTAGRYGEIVQWSADCNSGYNTRLLFSDPVHDFRSITVNENGILRALSFRGGLLTIQGDKQHLVYLAKTGMRNLLSVGDNQWILTSDGRLQDTYGKVCLPDTGITCAKMANGQLFIGKDDGTLTIIGTDGQSRYSLRNMYTAPVTAIAHDIESGTTALGYADGLLLLIDRNGTLLHRLVGHRSAVSGLVFFAGRLCSCSHDRTLRLWNITEDRYEPVIALESESWLLSLALSPDEKTLLAGDTDGKLYRLILSPDDLAKTLRSIMNDGLSKSEWDYYIGKGIPYEIISDLKQ